MRVETIGRATRNVTIYALCEYPSWTPRYVGKTTQAVGQRHKAHIRDAKRGGHRPVSFWLRKQIAGGKWLAVKHLEWLTTADDWEAREKFWIAKFRAEFGNLLNLTDGGEGTHGHQFSQEHKGRIAAALRTGSHFNCQSCGSKFWRKRYAIERGQNKFCSRACSNRRAK